MNTTLVFVRGKLLLLREIGQLDDQLVSNRLQPKCLMIAMRDIGGDAAEEDF